MKRLIVFVSLYFCIFGAVAQTKWNAAYQTYIDTYAGIAVEQMRSYGIPASITLAQGLLESGAGTSKLATVAKNHFGIKCNGWTGRTMSQDDDKPNECFRAYDSVRDSYEDHSLFLQRDRYKSLYSYSITDYKKWAAGLKACGYATSPTYAQRLIDIIEVYRLYEYDNGVKTPAPYSGGVASAQPVQTAPQQTGTVSLSGLAASSNDNASVPVAKTPYVSPNAHRVYYHNKNYYVITRAGDSFRSIGLEFDVSASALARYNERKKNDRFADGEVVYLRPKRGKAEKQYKGKPHVLRRGQSMYDVAQMYGITLKSLYKKNKLSPDHAPRVGEKLVVY